MALHLASLSKRGLGQHGNGPFTTPHPPPPPPPDGGLPSLAYAGMCS